MFQNEEFSLRSKEKKALLEKMSGGPLHKCSKLRKNFVILTFIAFVLQNLKCFLEIFNVPYHGGGRRK